MSVLDCAVTSQVSLMYNVHYSKLIITDNY